MDQDFFPQFSSGLELANSIVASDLLQHSWKAIMKIRGQTTTNGSNSLPRFGYYNDRPNCMIIAFNCSEDPFQIGEEGGNLVSFSSLKDRFPVFQFLCSKQNPDFSINGAALSRFLSFRDVYEQEIERMEPNTKLIITGHALGGSIASLFTLFLLDFLDLSKTTRPLCITFGSPLIGDERLQKAILALSTWNSCFLHVVSNNDPLPRVFLNSPSPDLEGKASNASGYYPFGTFFLCSEMGCACYEDPESILELLKATKPENTHQGLNPVSQPFDYKETVDCLKDQANYKSTTSLVTENMELLRGSLIAQLEAIGVVKGQAQQQRNNINKLTAILIEGETNLVIEKTSVFDPSKVLNDVKINLARMEWYLKKCKSQGIGYYDSYKFEQSEADVKVAEFKQILTNYWKKIVKEVERKPQKEGASFRTRWLYGGTNYRRMIEPLDIAEHYRNGLDNYISQRSMHYIKLEESISGDQKEKNDILSKKENTSAILTEDSCFWAHVEEALLSCQVLKMEDRSAEDNGRELAKLADFEELVVGLMKNYALSPYVFLPQSSFMKWWEEYDEIMGNSYNTYLTSLMRNEKYDDYAKGKLEIH